jgi:Predicted membrane protein
MRVKRGYDGARRMRNEIDTKAANPAQPAELAPIIVEPGPIARMLWLIRRAFIAAFEDNCYGIAKGAAYSTLLSIFPVLTTLAALLVQVRAESIALLISNFLLRIVPPGTGDLILSRFREQGTRPVLLLISAVVVSLWAASGAMASLMEGFQAAYRIPSARPFLKQRAMAIFLVLIVAIPALAASALILFGSRTEAALLHGMGIGKGEQTLRAPIAIFGVMLRYSIGFATIVFVTGLLYYFGPNHRAEDERKGGKMPSRFMRVWPGAILTTTLWLLTTALFGWYVGHIAHYNIFYGSIWTVIALLIWMYLLSVITLVGCEYNAERERMYSLLSLY